MSGRHSTRPGGSLTSWWAGLSALASLALAGLVGCGPSARPQGGTTPVRPVGTLHAPADYGLELTIDQEVTAEHLGGSESFRAVLEKRGDRLVMVGLGPHGGRAFVLTQEGLEVRFESQMPRELPFPPEFMLMDIHRTWLRGLAHGRGTPLTDGRHEAALEGEVVSELWAGGRLLERRYTSEGTPWWSVLIRYEGGLGADGTLPTRVVIDSSPAPEQRYRLVLSSLSGSISEPSISEPSLD